MRELTVSRESMGYRGDWYKLKIYVSDPNGNVVIKGMPCTLLCTLHGDETRTCPISNDEVTIFAIFSKSTKNYKYDMRIIPAGYDNVHLHGKSMVDYWAGVVFSFDGETPPQVKADAKRFGTILIISTIIAFFVGCTVAVVVRLLI